MQHLLPNHFTLLSRLFCIGSVALLVRSYRVGDWITHQHVTSKPPGTVGARDWKWESGAGGVGLSLTRCTCFCLFAHGGDH